MPLKTPASISLSPGSTWAFVPSMAASGAAVCCVLINCDAKIPATGPFAASTLATFCACCWPSAVSAAPGTAVSISFAALATDCPWRTRSITIDSSAEALADARHSRTAESSTAPTRPRCVVSTGGE